MILFGRKAHHLGLETTSSFSCLSCGKQQIAVSLFLRYFHILWLPMFPIKRQAASQCLNCRKVMVEKDFPRELKSQAFYLREKCQTPYWAFAGVFVLVILYFLQKLIY